MLNFKNNHAKVACIYALTLVNSYNKRLVRCFNHVEKIRIYSKKCLLSSRALEITL